MHCLLENRSVLNTIAVLLIEDDLQEMSTCNKKYLVCNCYFKTYDLIAMAIADQIKRSAPVKAGLLSMEVRQDTQKLPQMNIHIIN